MYGHSNRGNAVAKLHALFETWGLSPLIIGRGRLREIPKERYRSTHVADPRPSPAILSQDVLELV